MNVNAADNTGVGSICVRPAGSVRGLATSDDITLRKHHKILFFFLIYLFCILFILFYFILFFNF